MRKRFFVYLFTLVIALQLLLLPLSWLLSAWMQEGDIRSLLGDEGLRWLLGGWSERLSIPLLVNLLYVSMTIGMIRGSGFSLRITAVSVVTLTLVFFLLGGRLDAMFSVIGHFWPSPLSRSLVPLCCFMLMVSSGVYGFVNGRLTRWQDVWQQLVDGLALMSPWIVLLMLIAQLVFMFNYVFL